MEAYRTTAGVAEAELIERRSRFLGQLFPVENEKQAMEQIAAVRKQHWDARHVVFAYALREGQIRRASDDGEPQGTAGQPVLEVLRRAELTDCLLTVTRWFGGILLGTGGLTRAYGQTATLTLQAAHTVWMRPCVRARLCCDYAQYGRVQPLIVAAGGVVEDTAFTDEVTVTFHLPSEKMAWLSRELTEWSAGTLAAEPLAEIWFPYDMLD